MIIDLVRFKQLLKEKKFESATLLLNACTSSRHALAIFSLIIEHDEPRCWLAFVKNSQLCQELNQKEIQLLMKRVQTLIKNAVEENDLPDPLLHRIRKAIVKNEILCRRVSYNYFLTYAYDTKWLYYLLSSPHFLKHLDYATILKLINKQAHLSKKERKKSQATSLPLPPPQQQKQPAELDEKKTIKFITLILTCLARLLEPFNSTSDKIIAAKILKELLIKKPFTTTYPEVESLIKDLVLKVHALFLSSTEDAEQWLNQIVKEPHLLKRLESNVLCVIASKNNTYAVTILQSLESLLDVDVPNDDRQIAANVLEEIVFLPPFDKCTRKGELLSSLSCYYYGDGEDEKSQRYLTLACEEGCEEAIKFRNFISAIKKEKQSHAASQATSVDKIRSPVMLQPSRTITVPFSNFEKKTEESEEVARKYEIEEDEELDSTHLSYEQMRDHLIHAVTILSLEEEGRKKIEKEKENLLPSSTPFVFSKTLEKKSSFEKLPREQGGYITIKDKPRASS